MKKLVLTVILVSSLVVAEDSSFKTCSIIENLAKMTMDLRQSGVPMSTLYKEAIKVRNSATKKMLKTMIKQAYVRPVFTTQSFKKDAIKSFGNLWFNQCINTIDK